MYKIDWSEGMDDFNNFFDDQRTPQPEHTPVYHTPSPKQNNKLGAAGIISIVVAAVMCVVVLINVIVLASLKESIAQEYANSISQSMKEQYKAAIDEALNGTDVVDDVTDAATEAAMNALKKSVGQIANEYCAPSVARLYMAESKNSASFDGVASGFLISDSTSQSNARYLLTNAHCVRYEKATTGGPSFGFGYRPQTTYTWATYGTIICQFDGEETYYLLEAVAYGSYAGEYLSAENNQADIAILKIVGQATIASSTVTCTNTNQPSNDAHPALKIVSDDTTYARGDAVALVGNPEGFGDTNSISTGCISQKDVTIDSWGAGTFIMTDAAVNGGNSGGPMVNILGKVVGIVESKLVDESIDNMGFALSAQTIRDFIDWANQNYAGLNLTV